jgi:hypothetical protein
MAALLKQGLSVCTVDYIAERLFVTTDCKELTGGFTLPPSIHSEGLLQRNLSKQPEETGIPGNRIERSQLLEHLSCSVCIAYGVRDLQ